MEKFARKESKNRQSKRNADVIDESSASPPIPPSETVMREIQPPILKKMCPMVMANPPNDGIENSPPMPDPCDMEPVLMPDAQEWGDDDMSEFLRMTDADNTLRSNARAIDHRIGVLNNARYGSWMEPVVTPDGDMVSN